MATVSTATGEGGGGWASIARKDAPVEKKPDIQSLLSTDGLKTVVVDANAIIGGGVRLARIADQLFTVREVLAEVRDPASRFHLATLPVEIKCLEPSEDALTKVAQFARATGDVQSLSEVDMKLIALTYTLEAQVHGTDHIRTRPPPLVLTATKGGQRSKDPPVVDSAVVRDNQRDVKEPAEVDNLTDKAQSEQLRKRIAAKVLMVVLPNQQRELGGGAELAEKNSDDRSSHGTAICRPELSAEDAKDVGDFPHSDCGIESSDLTEEALHEEEAGKRVELRVRMMKMIMTEIQPAVQELALQNVILQMGLRLLSPLGPVCEGAEQVGTKVCQACFKVTTETDRLFFCPKCGGREGAVINPILREDQLPANPRKAKKPAEFEAFSSSDVVFRHEREKRFQKTVNESPSFLYLHLTDVFGAKKIFSFMLLFCCSAEECPFA
ncbi:hypothetical protein R1flu_017270 [Riccia fluitans]|uniref:Ribonuclease PIN domain-containing protein n=1 Tax=Riccia fluitans TaxID=41844 RepID=A0ABD1XDP6_9MARC